jgi:hypothetical protein
VMQWLAVLLYIAVVSAAVLALVLASTPGR